MESVEVFRRTLNARFRSFKSELDATLKAFSEKKDEQSRGFAEKLAHAGRDLESILSNNDLPAWVLPITNAAKAYAANPQHDGPRWQLLQVAMNFYPSVKPIGELTASHSVYDFDKLYDTLLKEGSLPELFQRMIDVVSQIIESGQVDSLTVTRSLEKLLAILKANQNGSYVSVWQSFSFSKFLFNCAIGYLKSIPTIKVFLEAWEKTIEEGERKIAQLQASLQAESLRLLVDDTSMGKLESIKEQFSIGDAQENSRYLPHLESTIEAE